MGKRFRAAARPDAGDLAGNIQGAGDADVATECLAVHEFGNQVTFTDIEQAYDVGMVQCSHGAGFLLESLQARPVLRNFLGQDFERNLAPAINFAHSTCA